MHQNCYAERELHNWFDLCGSGLKTATELLASESGMVLRMRSRTLLTAKHRSFCHVASVTMVNVVLNSHKYPFLIFKLLLLVAS